MVASKMGQVDLYCFCLRMGNKQSMIVICLCFAFVIGIRFELSEKIMTYFQTRSVAVLHLFICNQKDNFHLRKNENFSSFLSIILYNRPVQWDMMKQQNTGWFVDSSCYINRNLLRYIPESLLGTGSVWLIRGELDEVLVTLKQMYIGLSTDLVLAEDNGTYYDVYKLMSKSELKINRIEKLCFPPKRSRYNLEKNILSGGFVLTSFKVNNETIGLILDKYYRPQSEKLNRISYAYFTHLSHLYNFTIDILISETYGYKSDNGTYNGLIRDLVLKRVEFGGSAMAITKERLRVVDYTTVIVDVVYLFIFMEEKGFGGPRALAQPFSSYVWVALLIITGVSILVTLVLQLPENPLSMFVHDCIHIVSIMSSQGLANDFPWQNAKFLSTILLLFSLIITIFYHTSIMNGLLSPTPIKIKTIQDVLDKKKIGLANLSYLSPVFFHPLVQNKLRETTQKVYEIPLGIKTLQQDKTFSLIGDEKSIHEPMEQSFTDYEKCNVRKMPMSSRILAATTIRKNSHYKEMILQGQLLLIERGIAQRENKYWFTDAPKCLLRNAFFPVSLESIFIGLSIYLTGFILSIIAFLAEIIKKKKKNICNVTPRS